MSSAPTTFVAVHGLRQPDPTIRSATSFPISSGSRRIALQADPGPGHGADLGDRDVFAVPLRALWRHVAGSHSSDLGNDQPTSLLALMVETYPAGRTF